MICYHKGKYIPQEQLNLAVSTPAFQYGYGVFTSLRTEEGEGKLLSRHLERLKSNCEHIGLGFPQLNFADIIRDLVRLNNSPNLRIKIILYEDLNQQTGLIVIASQLNIYTSPISLTVISQNYEQNSFRSIKSLNYLENVLLHRQAVAKGFEEGLLVNSHNLICECCYANIFFIKEGTIHTPIANNNILNGIMRQEFIRQHSVIERDILLTELTTFDQVFITNSVQGLVPVKQIDENLYKPLTVLH